MKKRYERNFNLVSEEEFNRIQEIRVAVIGLGGLGGNILEMLARFGFTSILALDCDVFDETNLNRQLLSTELVLGQSKAQVAFGRIKQVNSEVHLEALNQKFTYELGMEVLTDVDIVFDALDNIQSRKELAKVCGAYNLPLVHGAIDGWYGQVSVIVDHSQLIEKLYSHDHGHESGLGNPSFTPAIVAGIQVSEGVKYLLNKGIYLKNKVLFIDLLEHMYEIVEIEG